MATLTGTITDRVKLAATTSLVTALTLNVAERLIVRGTPVPQWRLHLRLRDVVKIDAVSTLGALLRGLLTDTLVGQTLLYGGAVHVIRDRLGLRGRLTTAQRSALRESLRLVVRQQIQGRYQRRIADHLALRARLDRNVGAMLRDSLRFVSSLQQVYRVVRELSDRLEVHDVLTPQLVLLVFADDTITLDAGTLLRQIFDGQLQDRFDFILDVVDPGGDVTTWAMNVRTGAVSEYMNYAFRSMVQGPNGTYLGADDTGLYELVGPDDAGTAVAADIISGLAEFSGSNLSSMKAAYLAVRGQGTYYLRLTSGDGKSYVYSVRAQSLKTSRINIGKGLRARYFTFELISTGQDFDLLGLEFLPIQQQRRV